MELHPLIPHRSCIPSVQVVKTQKEHRVGPSPKPKVKASLTAKHNVSLGVSNLTASYHISTFPVFPNKTEPLLSTVAYFICSIQHKQLPPNAVFMQKPIANQLT